MLTQISKADVHRITSGQVIIDLLSITKELIENSIDAHTDLVELIFKEYGLESIEINDHGVGIETTDFPSLCLKHYTSKISSFEDLDSVQTLGFRGEALSSVCAVSTIKIETATKQVLPQTHELVYDHMGNLTSQKLLVNKRTHPGTKVLIGDLFRDLPVRRKNFEKNIKKEFNKALQFLYNYIIINPHIKFQVFNVINGQKKNILTTQKSTSILNNFIILYGTQSVASLKPLDIVINENFKITGYISTISIGKGRMVKDRQYLYLNNRPIIHKPLLKIINDTYHSFNNLQYPNFIINLMVTTGIDVNLTPNKMLINFEQDLEAIKEEFMKYWAVENMAQDLKVNQTSLKDFVQDKKEVRGVQVAGDSKLRQLSSESREPHVGIKSHRPVKRVKFDYSSDMFKTHNLTSEAKVGSMAPVKVKIDGKKVAAASDVGVDREITVNKLSFNDMALVGQFNLGFLITRLDNHLFIVDQHASDEKYNYETLKDSFKVESQLLIKPIVLKLNLVELNKLIQYRDIVEKNGFKINDQMELTHLPNYKHYQFDVNDLTELINQLPSITYLPKVHSLIAMKACRKSIMIGQHLNTPTMKRILHNLAGLDKPWNCPHGRPTLRYLKEMNSLEADTADYEI